MNEIIKRCINHKVPFVSYMILHLLYNEEQDVLVNYCINVSKIETKEFLWLIDNKYLEEVKNRDLIIVEDLVLTDKFSSEILKITNTKNITFDVAFDQLRNHFPSKAGNSERRLQGDPPRCKRLYQNIIMKNDKIDVELHSMILQCINYEINVKTKSRSLEYFKLLTTWLQQKEYELYIKDVEEVIKKNGSVNIASNGGFSEDV